MRFSRMPVRVLAFLFVSFAICQAKTDYAYVANLLGNTVSVINTTNNTVVKTIPVGTSPWGVAVNQAGTLAYVTNHGSNNVSVINTSTNAVTGTIPVGNEPLGVAFTPNGKTAYVANDLSNSVSVINTATKKVTATIPVQNSPYGVVVTPNGAFAYVSNLGSGSVSVISTLTNTVVATVTVGNSPYLLAVSPDSTTVYVPSQGTGTISVIRTADNTVTNTITVDGAWGSAVSPDGHWVYASDSTYGSQNLVSVIDTSAQKVTKTIVVGQNPNQVSFSQDSAFAYVASGGPSGTNTVDVINTSTQAVVGSSISVGNTPVGVAVMGTMKVTTVVGGYVGDGGAATNAALFGPYDSVEDSSGNVYISDFLGNRIRKVDATTGNISTYAGTGIWGYNGENVRAAEALIDPNGIVLDAAGEIVFAGDDARIRKISVAGIVTTIAGDGVFGYTGDGGPAIKAAIGQPFKLAYDAAKQNLYFSQVGNCVVRKIDSTGTITTVAGNGTCGFGGDGKAATSAELNLPRGVALDSNGNLYIGDTNNCRVRKVTAASGKISTFAGNGTCGFSGDGGKATSAAVGGSTGLAVENGVLYIANGGSSRVRAVNLSTQIITTYAGSSFGFGGDGGPLLSALFSGPESLDFSSAGNPFFADSLNARVRTAASGTVSTFAGGFIADGNKATDAALVFPEALAIDKSGNIYIADFTGNRVRKVSGGTITTLAGTDISGYSGDGGAATSALLNAPQGVAVDSLGNVYIADTDNGVIRKVAGGTITTFATNANFSYLLQMATDSANNVYVADGGACVVWKITPSGTVTVAAGVVNVCNYNSDGIPATTAYLNGPYGVAFDGAGDLYIADNNNARLREVNTSGTISTIAGNGTCGYTGDGGLATAAEVCPNSVAVDKAGNIYMADFSFEKIRKISGGIITTYAGSGFGFNGDGFWPLYTGMDDPVAVAVDSKGVVYELDDWDHRVRQIK
jgi:YVTN family beta-propeller protein